MPRIIFEGPIKDKRLKDTRGQIVKKEGQGVTETLCILKGAT